MNVWVCRFVSPSPQVNANGKDQGKERRGFDNIGKTIQLLKYPIPPPPPRQKNCVCNGFWELSELS